MATYYYTTTNLGCNGTYTITTNISGTNWWFSPPQNNRQAARECLKKD